MHYAPTFFMNHQVQPNHIRGIILKTCHPRASGDPIYPSQTILDSRFRGNDISRAEIMQRN